MDPPADTALMGLPAELLWSHSARSREPAQYQGQGPQAQKDLEPSLPGRHLSARALRQTPVAPDTEWGLLGSGAPSAPQAGLGPVSHVLGACAESPAAVPSPAPHLPPPDLLTDARDSKINSHPHQDTARRRQITAAALQPRRLIFLAELHNKKSMADAAILMHLPWDRRQQVMSSPSKLLGPLTRPQLWRGLHCRTAPSSLADPAPSLAPQRLSTSVHPGRRVRSAPHCCTGPG